MNPTRRDLLRTASATLALPCVNALALAQEPAPKKPARPFLYTGGGPARGNPGPHTLKGEEQEKARLTPETWRLEIVADGDAKVDKPRTLEAGNAIDLPMLME